MARLRALAAVCPRRNGCSSLKASPRLPSSSLSPLDTQSHEAARNRAIANLLPTANQARIPLQGEHLVWRNFMFGDGYTGILGIIILILDIYAIIRIVQSGAEPLWKALWIVIVLLLPVLGLILWFLFGPK